MAGGFFRGFLVEDLNTPVGARRAENKLAGNVQLCGDQRACQAAAARAGKLHCVLCVAIRHQRRNRAKSFG